MTETRPNRGSKEALEWRIVDLEREVEGLKRLLLEAAREFRPGTPPGSDQRFYQRVVRELDPR